MPITDFPQQLLPISAITVNRDERQRRVIETADLEQSISQIGLINPIVVRQECCGNPLSETDGCCGTYDYILVAGERRLQACKNLNWTEIPVRFAHDLSEIESSIIELEENIKRQDLEWQERVNAIAKIHSLHLQLDPDWTMTETAAATSLTVGTISHYLGVAPHLETSDRRIVEAGTFREAYNVLKRRDARQQANSLEELLSLPLPEEAKELADAGVVVKLPTRAEPSPLSDTILHGSFLEWAPSYSGPRFNFIHCDFPYGINPFSGEQGRGANPSLYEDDTTIYFNLIDCLCENINRLASVSCHIMFWFSMKLHQATLLQFSLKAPQIVWQPHPLVWLKSDNAGISPDPARLPRHIYETALLGSIGSRQIVRVVADAYSSTSQHDLHPSMKPESMLRHFFSMLVDEHTSMLDPTCGSGTALRAAESLSATHCLGLESEWEYAEAARLALRKFRTLRQTGT